MKNRILFIFTYLFLSHTFAQVYDNKILDNNIKTVQLFPKNIELAMPIIQLNTNEILELHFDDLSNTPKNYYYTILQCKSDWTLTTLNQMEYIDGFTEEIINNYEYSSNTKQKFVHYTMQIPNLYTQINKSGNYILIVYETNKDEPVFTKRFMVSEQMVNIKAGIAYPRNTYTRNKYQEIVFDVNYKDFKIDNPNMEIKATILQNYRWDNAIQNLPPMYTNFNILNYDYNGKIVFQSNREFRQLDLRSLRFRGQSIRSLNITEEKNDVFLLYDLNLNGKNYIQTPDYNGQFFIQNLDNNTNPNITSDYANTYFNLDFEKLYSGNFYVVGNFNNWQYNNESKLKYNQENKLYETNILLKQGLYNYAYIYVNDNNETDQSMVEGYYLDTENDYTILLYYTPFGERYDRLIAVKHINSLLNRY